MTGGLRGNAERRGKPSVTPRPKGRVKREKPTDHRAEAEAEAARLTAAARARNAELDAEREKRKKTWRVARGNEPHALDAVLAKLLAEYDAAGAKVTAQRRDAATREHQAKWTAAPDLGAGGFIRRLDLDFISKSDADFTHALRLTNRHRQSEGHGALAEAEALGFFDLWNTMRAHSARPPNPRKGDKSRHRVAKEVALDVLSPLKRALDLLAAAPCPEAQAARSFVMTALWRLAGHSNLPGASELSEKRPKSELALYYVAALEKLGVTNAEATAARALGWDLASIRKVTRPQG